MNHPRHTERYVPLISALTPECIQWIKHEAGFPNDWSALKISSWLGPIYDRIIFIINRDKKYINSTPYLDTRCHNNPQNIDLDYVRIMIPIDGFKQECMVHLFRSMLNIDINCMFEWIDYLNEDGRDRFMIHILRYKNTDICLNYH